MRLEHLEYLRPIIKSSVSRVSIEGFGFVEGSFELTNIGEGELSGSIYSAQDNLELSPESFVGNRIKVAYMFNLSDYKPGDTVTTKAIIRSNGGELIVPFDICVAPAGIVTKDGITISSFAQFYDYAQESPVAARSLLGHHDFMTWLFNSGYQYMDIYEKISADSNKERALDNFFVFNELKKKASIFPESRYIKVRLGLDETAATGGIKLLRSSRGYADAEIFQRTGGSWLKLTKSRVTSADFEGDEYELGYIILASELKGRAMALIDIVCENTKQAPEQVYLMASYKKAFSASLDKFSYSFEDSGDIYLSNETDSEIVVDIKPNEGFIKLKSKRYVIGGKKAKIPFEIKYSALANMRLRKKNFDTGSLYISSIVNGVATTQLLTIKMSSIL